MDNKKENNMFCLKYHKILSYAAITLYLTTAALVLLSAVMIYPPSELFFSIGITQKISFAVRVAMPFPLCGAVIILINLITKRMSLKLCAVLFAFSVIPSAMLFSHMSSVPGSAYRYLYSVIIFFTGCYVLPLINYRRKPISDGSRKSTRIIGGTVSVIALSASSLTLFCALSGGAIAKALCFLYAFFPLTFISSVCAVTSGKLDFPAISFVAASLLCSASAAFFVIFRAYGVPYYELLSTVMLCTGVLFEVISLCMLIYHTVKVTNYFKKI